jgi:hypothetical protein
MADENPYESPHSVSDKKPSRGNMVALVLIILLSIPAGAIAFFAVCLGSFVVGGANDSSLAVDLVLGGIGGVGILGGGIYWATRVYQRSKQR